MKTREALSSKTNKRSFKKASSSSSSTSSFSLSPLKKYLSNIFGSKLAIISFLVLLIACLILAFNSSPSYLLSSVNLLFQKKPFTTNNLNNNHQQMASSESDWKNAKTIYEFKADDIDGNPVELSKYKGRVVLIVNVACACGLTSGNYPQMQELHEKYNSQGLSVLAFPCNQFGGQEPKPEKEIKDFVKQYNVQFDMFSKINVNGDGAHPLYKFLKSKVDGTFGNFIKWNFSKFLIDRQGVPVKRYSPTTPPKDIEDDIVKLLNNSSAL